MEGVPHLESRAPREAVLLQDPLLRSEPLLRLLALRHHGVHLEATVNLHSEVLVAILEAIASELACPGWLPAVFPHLDEG